jgi:hypothetical protein
MINVDEAAAFRCANLTLFTLFFGSGIIATILRLPSLKVSVKLDKLSNDTKFLVFVFIGVTFVYIFLETFLRAFPKRFLFTIWCLSLASVVVWTGTSELNDEISNFTILLSFVFFPFAIYPRAILHFPSFLGLSGLSVLLVLLVALAMIYLEDKMNHELFSPLIAAVIVGFVWISSMYIFQLSYERNSSQECLTLVMFPFLAPVDSLRFLIE